MQLFFVIIIKLGMTHSFYFIVTADLTGCWSRNEMVQGLTTETPLSIDLIPFIPLIMRLMTFLDTELINCVKFERLKYEAASSCLYGLLPFAIQTIQGGRFFQNEINMNEMTIVGHHREIYSGI